MKTSKRSIKHLGVWIGAGVFVMAVGAPVVRADETVIEKRTQESHSYKVEEAPVVTQHNVVTEHTETTEHVPPPTVVEKRTTVETVPAPPVVQRRTTETTTHTED